MKLLNFIQILLLFIFQKQFFNVESQLDLTFKLNNFKKNVDFYSSLTIYKDNSLTDNSIFKHVIHRLPYHEITNDYTPTFKFEIPNYLPNRLLFSRDSGIRLILFVNPNNWRYSNGINSLKDIIAISGREYTNSFDYNRESALFVLNPSATLSEVRNSDLDYQLGKRTMSIIKKFMKIFQVCYILIGSNVWLVGLKNLFE